MRRSTRSRRRLPIPPRWMPETDTFARALLRAAVEIPSPSGREAAVVRRLRDLLTPSVDEAGVDEVGNLLVRHGHGPRTVTFLGHVDTVPGTIPVEEREGALYGRGSVDAKGSLTAALAAVVGMSESTRERLTVRVIGAVGEEAPGSVGARHVARTLPPPDLLIVCEPSGWDAMTLGYKGHVRLQLAVTRTSRHAAGPGGSAGDRLVEAVTRLRRHCEERTQADARAFDRVQCTVLDLAVVHDGLRERASAQLGIRLPEAWPAERLLADLRSTFASHDVELKSSDAVDAVRGTKDSDLARAFRTAIRASNGRPRSVVKTGTSDWNVVAPAWPVPTLAYGPGDAALDHTPNEHLELASFDASVEVLSSVLERLASGVPTGPTGRSSSG